MTRGSGLKGLTSLERKTTIKKIDLIRPLLDFEKKNLEFISKYVFNFFIKDPTNENIHFKRIQMRKIISNFKKSGIDKDRLFFNFKKFEEL